jgi:hypothetical protein
MKPLKESEPKLTAQYIQNKKASIDSFTKKTGLIIVQTEVFLLLKMAKLFTNSNEGILILELKH